MTIVDVLVEPRRLTAVTDTLVVHRPGEAHAPREARALATKVIPLPAFRGLIGFSGPTLVGVQVLLRTFSAPSADT